MVVPTLNYGFEKPDVGGDKDIWGATQNGALDQVDAQIKVNEDAITQNTSDISDNATAIGDNATAIGVNADAILALQTLIPSLQIQIGSLYTSRIDLDPAAVAAKLGYGVWGEAVVGRALVGAGTGDAPDATPWAVGEKRGTEQHQLSIDELAAHTHEMAYRERLRDGQNNEVTDFGGSDFSKETTSTGDDEPHNNTQPSEAYFIYERLS